MISRPTWITKRANAFIRDDRPQLWGQGLILQGIAALLGGSGVSPDPG